jgi:hypothetical protein
MSKIGVSVSSLPEDFTTVIVIPGDMIGEFLTLIERATNCWPDASPDMKDFADNMIHGRPLQDYHAQANLKPRPE